MDEGRISNARDIRVVITTARCTADSNEISFAGGPRFWAFRNAGPAPAEPIYNARNEVRAGAERTWALPMLAPVTSRDECRHGVRQGLPDCLNWFHVGVELKMYRYRRSSLTSDGDEIRKADGGSSRRGDSCSKPVDTDEDPRKNAALGRPGTARILSLCCPPESGFRNL